MKIVIRFPKELENFKGQWVSMSMDFSRVIGYGVTAKEAGDMADETGEDGILYFVPEHPEMLRL